MLNLRKFILPNTSMELTLLLLCKHGLLTYNISYRPTCLHSECRSGTLRARISFHIRPEEDLRNRLKHVESIADIVSQYIRRVSTTPCLHAEELFVHRDSKDNNSETPFEFSEANMMRIAALIQNYPEGCQRSAVGGCIDIVQRQIGWVPIAAMHKVAQILNMPRMRVYEYCTFYTMVKRHYRGKYHVKVCKTTPCMLRGADIILQAVEEATCCCIGGVSEDGMFGVDTVECGGACANAPIMVIDDDYYEDLTVCDVQNIIQILRCGGIPPPGPQSGRFSCEPICGLTSLCENPPPPGYAIQKALLSSSPCKPAK